MSNPAVTYAFTNGTTADGAQVSQNFTDLINSLTDGTKALTVDSITCTSASQFSSRVTIGSATDTRFALYINGSSLMTGTDQTGCFVDAACSSAATSSYTAVTGRVRTAAASFVCPLGFTFSANQMTLGSGSTLTRHVNYYCTLQTGASHNADMTNSQTYTGNWGVLFSHTRGNRFDGGFGSIQSVDSSSSGNLTAIPTTAGIKHFSSVTAKTLCGLVAPTTAYAQVFIVTNTGGNMTVAHQSSTETTAANRITTNTGSDVLITGQGAATFVYSTTDTAWLLVSVAQ